MFFRKKKEKEPASYLSPLGTELTNYNVYYLNFREKLQAFAIALFIGGAVSLVFYGNQFLDATGRATKATMYGNIVIFLLVGRADTKPMMKLQNKLTVVPNKCSRKNASYILKIAPASVDLTVPRLLLGSYETF